MPPARLMERSSSSSSNYPGQALPEVPIETRTNPDDLDQEDFLSDGCPVAFTEQRHESDDELESEETFDHQIHEDMQEQPNSSNRSPQALYEDIRSLQRKIIELASETLASTEEEAPMHENSASGASHLSRLVVDGQDLAQAARNRGLNRTTPYRSLGSNTTTTGLNLVELRASNQLLLEDTLGNIHYLPLSVGARWQVCFINPSSVICQVLVKLCVKQF
ncbi:hypothetical protein BKA65DRAFT_547136 [Rhexocercosporidium sp. MPI-PUGE-AT-0058]|nr:hypothetical protein BKA65DRAFT_547136 [Rhexocercosporidium sp. MPI-PUGE-AT-0058]